MWRRRKILSTQHSPVNTVAYSSMQRHHISTLMWRRRKNTLHPTLSTKYCGILLYAMMPPHYCQEEEKYSPPNTPVNPVVYSSVQRRTWSRKRLSTQAPPPKPCAMLTKHRVPPQEWSSVVGEWWGHQSDRVAQVVERCTQDSTTPKPR